MSNRTNGRIVRELESQFAAYVGAKYGIACCNGTATLHTALVALGVQPGDTVAVPPLTMAATTLGVLHAGANVDFFDVDQKTWLMAACEAARTGHRAGWMPVSLYGMHSDFGGDYAPDVIVDAAQTLNAHRGAAFTSYSFQASKILNAGEGGMLVTNDDALADKARQFRDLGYPRDAREHMKRPDAIRHTVVGWNYRMSDAQAQLVFDQLPDATRRIAARQYAALCYAQAIEGCDWLTPQYVPDGWPHSYWAYAIACDTPQRALNLAQAIENHGGERPYFAWRLTYREPAFRHLAPDGTCPVAEDLQPRLLQLQTNHNTAEAERAAEILRRAIQAL